MEMTYENSMVLPKNFAQHTRDDMMYLEGGAYISKAQCRQICTATLCTPQGMIAMATTTAMAAKIIQVIKAGGPLGFIAGFLGSLAAGALGKVAYGIGYGAINRGVDISLSPAPWECFVNVELL